MSLLQHARTVSTVASSAGGAVLATASRVAAVRPAAKPLHPQGRVRKACLYRHGLQPPLGIAWLDEAGIDEVVVRESRAIGLPGSLPDIHGLAIRVPLGADGFGDLLFASTGFGKLSRFVLTASRDPQSRPMTTLLPYRTAAGPLLLGARLIGEQTVELSCAVNGDDWRLFADLRLSDEDAGDADISFDPVLHQVPGLEQYPAVERLREPAYHQARASRED